MHTYENRCGSNLLVVKGLHSFFFHSPYPKLVQRIRNGGSSLTDDARRVSTLMSSICKPEGLLMTQSQW